MTHDNLLGALPPTLLPADPAAPALQDPAADLTAIAAAHPASSLAWARLAEQALDDGQHVTGYAFARTGYHRGLDALRRSGWRGQGPVPWSHEPNRGFLRAVAALGRAARAIGEQDEADRCAQLLEGSDPAAVRALG